MYTKKLARLNNSYWAMVYRCNKPSHQAYKRYGGAGIKVCRRWLGKDGFRNFCFDMGQRPEGKSLDRIKNHLGYCKGNCKWSTSSEQNRNTKATVYLVFRGARHPMIYWANLFGIHKCTLWARLNRDGMTVERALTQPMRITKRTTHSLKIQQEPAYE